MPINTAFSWLHVQFKSHVLVSVEQLACVVDVVLVDMHIRKVKRDGLQGQVNLPSHKIEVVDVGRQAEVRV